MDPVPDPILPEKFLGYSQESNPGPLGWQSDMLTIIPNRWSKITKELVIFKEKCRVGPHIPLQMYKFNVSQDLKPVLLTKW